VKSVNFDRAAGYYDKTRALPAATMAELTGLLAAELAGRATARELSPVPVRTVWTLAEAIDHVERQLFSWSWPYTAAQAAALADDLRGWAARAGVALDTAHETATAVRCWAFELR